MKRFIVIVTVIMSFVTIAYAGSFSDVKDTDWFSSNVSRLVEKGIINGYPDGTFKPNENMQADQFIKLVLVGLGNEDIPNGQLYWASEYINKAKELKILKNEDFEIYHNQYDYTRIITREEMAIIIDRALKDKEDNIINNNDDQKAYATLIKEYSILSDLSKKPITEIYAKGILTGYPDGYFKPYKGLTRAEATTVILRLVDENERVKVAKPSKTIDELEEDEEDKLLMPKNAADFYRINPEIPIELYEYEYNQKAKYPVDAFMTNKELYNDLVYNSVYEGTGRQLLGKIKKYALEYLDAVYNMDYTKDSTEIMDKIRYHINDTYANEKYWNDFINKLKENEVISKYEFLTDDSLIYQDIAGGIRIRGRYKLMYLSNNTRKVVCPDIEYNNFLDMPIELNRWYEQDIEIRFVNTFGQALWNRTEFTCTDEISLE